MITLLAGENSFEQERAVQEIVRAFDGVPERIDGSDVTAAMLPDLLASATLFADKRLVIIKKLSENTAGWTALGDFLPRMSDDVALVLVETKPDKRTKTYKTLQKQANVREFAAWGERDESQAEQWAVQEAAGLGFSLDRQLARLLVERVGVDQWQLYRALEKLAVAEEVTKELIEDVIEANPSENVFLLFESALRGNRQRVADMIGMLQLNDDPYRLFGLLGGQAFQLLAIAVAEPGANVAKDLGVHPYALQKMAPYAKSLGVTGAKKVAAAFAEADEAMKSSAADPWLLIERALIKTAEISK